jgi:hypothetical protein
MKKSVLLGVLSVMILFSSAYAISAQVNGTQSIVNDALSCLNDKVDDCSALSLEEQIFSALATGKCVSEIQESASNDECWPSGACNVRMTALATLALNKAGRQTDEAEAWLLSRRETPSDLIWYLQIENPAGDTSCTISYDENPYNIILGEDKKINVNAGTCLTRSQNSYWLRVSPSCYGTEFTITCDEQFLTSKLYQRQGDSTIYVSESSNSASAGGTVSDEVNSFCFGTGSCDYEASLWASLVLDSVGSGENTTYYLPYLTVLRNLPSSDDYLPDAFLYALTSSVEYSENLFGMQKTVNGQKYWDQNSGEGRFYDTAVALLPFQGESPAEKTNSEVWLSSVQDADGCWNNGNIRDTAFILYSVFGKSATPSTDTLGCESSGFYCLSSLSCGEAGGEALEGYSCSTGICCSQDLTFPTCAEQDGTVCNSGEVCEGGSTAGASDLLSGQICCIAGTCNEPSQEISDCELAQGVCRASSCRSGEQEIFESCDFSSDVCCIPGTSGGKSYWWIWVLSILIILAVLGIIFREKLKRLWFRIKSKFKKGGKGPQRPGPRGPPGPPPFGPGMTPRPVRRVTSPIPKKATTKKIPGRSRRSQTELDTVLKKLKDIGKGK